MINKTRVVHITICVLLFLTGMYFVPIRTMRLDFSQLPGDLVDSRLNNYFLEHGHLFFSGKLSNYWSAPFVFPEPNMITFSDNLLGTLPIYSAFRIVGCDRESAYQGWILILFALNFITATYVLNKWTKNLSLSAIGGYIFAFSMPMIAQMGHTQILPRFMIPFVMMWLIYFFNTGKLKYFLYLGIGCVFQFYAGIYLGFLLLLVVLSSCLIFVFFKTERKNFFAQLNKGKVVQMIGLMVICGFLLLPLMYPYYLHSKEYQPSPYEIVLQTVPVMESYFFPWV